jgi:flavin-dependent dehydrogenase
MQDFLKTDPLASHANRSAWGGDGRLIDYDFIRDPYGNGWHIDRSRFDRMLIDAAVDAGANVLQASAVEEIERVACGWSARINGAAVDRRIVAELVFDCTGRRAGIARRLGTRRVHVDRLVAASTYLSSESPVDDATTLIEAVPEGWWYSARIPGMRLAIAFMTDPDLLIQTSAIHREGWLALLDATEHTRRRVQEGGFQLGDNPSIAAAGSSRLERAFGDGWLAAGDAAAAHDPLSSHGIGTAIASGAQAATAAVAYLRGDRGALQNYSRRAETRFDRYLVDWRRYYADVIRWPSAPFWSRRHRIERTLPAAALAD